MSKSKSILEFLFFAFSAVSLNGAKFIVEFFAAKKLGPIEYGSWSTVILFMMIVGQLHFGVLNAIWREIPFFMERNDIRKVNYYKQIGFTTILMIVITFVVLLIILDYFIYDFKLSLLTFFLFIFYFFSNKLYFLVQNLLRSTMKFNLASKQQIIAGFLLLIGGIVLTNFFGLNGLIVSYVISFFISLLLFYKYVLDKFSIVLISKKELVELIKVGFPIMLVGFLYIGITSVDRWIVVSFLGMESMGFYSFAFTIFQSGMMVLSLISTMYYPKLTAFYSKTNSIIETKNELNKLIKITIIVGIFFAAIIYFFAPVAIQFFMEKYISSIEIIRVLSFGLPFLGTSLLISSFFNIIKKQKYLYKIMIFTMLLNIIISLFALYLGFGTKGIAIASVISFMVYNIYLMKILRKITD